MNEQSDPCVTTDAEGKPHTGNHKWEWTNNGAPPIEYFKAQRCKNCGNERPAPGAPHD